VLLHFEAIPKIVLWGLDWVLWSLERLHNLAILPCHLNDGIVLLNRVWIVRDAWKHVHDTDSVHNHCPCPLLFFV
jgi:hypothetical protein